MPKVKLSFLETHTPLFHPAGKNFGTKIYFDDKRNTDAEAYYDDESAEVKFTYKGVTTNLSITAYAQWVGEKENIPQIVNEHKTEDKSKRSSAQVATPQSHVFEGRGQGKK